MTKLSWFWRRVYTVGAWLEERAIRHLVLEREPLDLAEMIQHPHEFGIWVHRPVALDGARACSCGWVEGYVR